MKKIKELFEYLPDFSVKDLLLSSWMTKKRLEECKYYSNKLDESYESYKNKVEGGTNLTPKQVWNLINEMCVDTRDLKDINEYINTHITMYGACTLSDLISFINFMNLREVFKPRYEYACYGWTKRIRPEHMGKQIRFDSYQLRIPKIKCLKED